jgi:ribosomal protein S20
VAAVEAGEEDRAAEVTRTYYQKVDGKLTKVLRAGMAASKSESRLKKKAENGESK